MKRLTVLMPDVSECTVTECAYNTEQRCHARAVTIGDGHHAACDTFLRANGHIRNTAQVAGVGACKVTACRFNTDLECQAETIRVGNHQDHADCMTFSPR